MQFSSQTRTYSSKIGFIIFKAGKSSRIRVFFVFAWLLILVKLCDDLKQSQQALNHVLFGRLFTQGCVLAFVSLSRLEREIFLSDSFSLRKQLTTLPQTTELLCTSFLNALLLFIPGNHTRVLLYREKAESQKTCS